MSKKDLSKENPDFKITKITISVDNQYFLIGSDEGKVYVLSQANIEKFGISRKNQISSVTDMVSYIDHEKLKIAVAHDNGIINFFECVNLDVNYLFHVEGRKDNLIYMPQVTSCNKYLVCVVTKFQDQ